MIIKQEESTGHLLSLEKKDGTHDQSTHGRRGGVSSSSGDVGSPNLMMQKAKEFDQYPGAAKFVDAASSYAVTKARAKKTKRITVEDAYIAVSFDEHDRATPEVSRISIDHWKVDCQVMMLKFLEEL